MKRIKSPDPDRIEYRGGGGCVALFGLPFLIVGVVLGVHAAMGNVQGNVWAAWIVAVLFTLVGAGMVFGRVGLAIDIRSRTFQRWWSCVFPLKRREGSLDAFHVVAISHEVRRTKNGTYTVFPVRLEGGGQTLAVDTARQDHQARAEAEFLAKALGLPLADRTGPDEVVRDPDHLDESLRDRLRRTGDPDRPMPEAPSQTRSTYRTEGTTITFEIPPVGAASAAGCGLLASMGFSLTVFFVVLRPILAQGNMPVEMKYVLIAFVGGLFVLAPFLLALGGFLRSLFRRTTVVASPDGLSVTHHGFGRAKAGNIVADELEDLRMSAVADRRGMAGSRTPIVATSDRASLAFGGHLAEPEKEWMLAVIERVVTA